jgi:hypothetical protein
MRSPLVALLAALSFTVACGSDTEVTDAGPAPDAAKDAPVSPCGALPAVTCKPGKAGAVCDTIAKPLQCAGGASQWACPAGSVPADQCGCNTGSFPGLQPGDACPGSAADAGTD